MVLNTQLTSRRSDRPGVPHLSNNCWAVFICFGNHNSAAKADSELLSDNAHLSCASFPLSKPRACFFLFSMFSHSLLNMFYYGGRRETLQHVIKRQGISLVAMKRRKTQWRENTRKAVSMQRQRRFPENVWVLDRAAWHQVDVGAESCYSQRRLCFISEEQCRLLLRHHGSALHTAVWCISLVRSSDTCFSWDVSVFSLPL